MKQQCLSNNLTFNSTKNTKMKLKEELRLAYMVKILIKTTTLNDLIDIII